MSANGIPNTTERALHVQLVALEERVQSLEELVDGLVKAAASRPTRSSAKPPRSRSNGRANGTANETARWLNFVRWPKECAGGCGIEVQGNMRAWYVPADNHAIYCEGCAQSLGEPGAP